MPQSTPVGRGEGETGVVSARRIARQSADDVEPDPCVASCGMPVSQTPSVWLFCSKKKLIVIPEYMPTKLGHT